MYEPFLRRLESILDGNCLQPPVNTTQANRDSSLNLNPSLYLVVHDPSLSLTDALDMGYTRMTLFNANGMTNVDLTLQYREKLGGAGFYDYRLNPSTVTARDLVCDLGSSDPSTAYPCHTSLFLGFPTFQRSVISQTYAMNGIVSFFIFITTENLTEIHSHVLFLY